MNKLWYLLSDQEMKKHLENIKQIYLNTQKQEKKRNQYLTLITEIKQQINSNLPIIIIEINTQPMLKKLSKLVQKIKNKIYINEENEKIINIFEEINFDLNLQNIDYSQLKIWEKKILNNKFDEVYSEIYKSQQLKLSLAIITFIQHNYAELKGSVPMLSIIFKFVFKL